MSEWQPIESAPKDGTLIMVWDNGFRKRYHVIRADDLCYRPLALYLDDPTHWMPLPKPPVTVASK